MELEMSRASVPETSDYVQKSNCTSDNLPTNIFAHSGGVIAGVFVGSQIEKKSAAGVLAKLLETASVSGRQVALQFCDTHAIDVRSTAIFGLYVDTTGSLSNVQQHLKSWNDAACLSPSSGDTVWQSTPISTIPGTVISIKPNTGTGNKTDTQQPARLVRRDSCTYTQAQAGDGCW
jgi:chitinase